MALEQLLQQLSASRRIVDERGMMTPEFQVIFQQLNDTFNTNVDETNTGLQATGNDSIYYLGEPSLSVLVNSNPSGVFPAGDPAFDLSIVFYDVEQTEIARRKLTGTLTSSNGQFNISAHADPPTGFPTTFSTSGNGELSARADITVTLANGEMGTGSLSWNSLDESTSGSTPVSGGGK